MTCLQPYIENTDVQKHSVGFMKIAIWHIKIDGCLMYNKHKFYAKSRTVTAFQNSNKNKNTSLNT